MNHALTRCSVAVLAGTAVWMLGSSIAFARPASSGGDTSAKSDSASSSAKSDSSKSDSSKTNSAISSDSPEPKTAPEKRASKLGSEAIGTDYWSGRHEMAEKKLREGIQICMTQHCSPAILAHLHRDLGVVYIAGMKHVEDGKDEFTAALNADPTVTLAASMVDMPAVKQAFDEAKAGMEKNQPDASKPAEKAEEKPAEKTKESEAPPAPREAEAKVEEPPTKDAVKQLLNWVSLGVQEDFVWHSKTSNACGSNSSYKCYDGLGARQPAYDSGSYVPGGNQVGSAGFQPGTLRILAGYDRVIRNRFTAGVRLGAVLLGKAKITEGDSSVMVFHGEARGAIWFGHDPFSAVLRPYALLSGGIAETDSKVSVQLQRTTNNDPHIYSFDAWKRSGIGFVGVGGGLVAAITKRGGPSAEVRFLQFFGSTSTSAVAAQIGYSFGF